MATTKKALEKTNLPQWHAALPNATIENVQQLNQVDHGWICTLIPATDEHMEHGVLAILDITNRVRGEGDDARYMTIGPCPNPDTHADDIAKALLATMMAPSKGGQGEYYKPRRPAWVLVDKNLTACLETVASTLAQVDVIVKLNTPEALAAQDDDDDDGDDDVAEDNRGRKATWDAGLGATPETVKALTQEKDQIWKCGMTMLEDPDTGLKECFLAVEDITDGIDEDSSYPLGVGPCPAATVNPDGMVRALFATMMSPRAKEGGGYGNARRPGRLVLEKALEPWLEHVQSKTESLGITVEV